MGLSGCCLRDIHVQDVKTRSPVELSHYNLAGQSLFLCDHFLAHTRRMLTTSILFCLAALLTSVSAQGDGRILGCMPDSGGASLHCCITQCCLLWHGFQYRPQPRELDGGRVQYSTCTSLNTFCSVDCGNSIVESSVVNCRNLDLADGLYLLCLPRENGEDRCRSIFPDLLENGDDVIANLASCSNFDTTCPDGCANALMT